MKGNAGISLRIYADDFSDNRKALLHHGAEALDLCVRDDGDLDELIEIEEARAALDAKVVPADLFDRLVQRWQRNADENATALGHVRAFKACYQNAWAIVDRARPH